MKLYQAPRAINPDRVVYFLRAKGKLDTVEMMPINIIEQEHRTPEYREMSPFAKVPVLQLDDGTCITESRAICTYFEALYPEPNLLGSTPLEKAQIEMWERQLEFMWMMPFAQWFRNTHPMMAPLEVPQLPEAAAKGEKAAKSFVKRLDQHMAGNEFVAADRFSNADILAYLLCGFSRAMQWSPKDEHQHIGAWFARMKDRGIAG